MRPGSEGAAAAAALTVVWLAFSWPWLWGGMTIPWDAKAHFYPMIRFVADSVAAGESVLWSPYHFGGFPMIADPQSMILTPSFWPVIAAGPAPSVALTDAVHLAHLLAGALAILAFGRLRGWGWPAALTAAAGYMLAGPATVRLEHLLMTVSYLWIAVALWRLEALLQRGGLWRAAVLGAVLGLLLVDRNHVAYLGAWLLAIYALVRIAPRPLERLWALAFAGTLALLIAAVPVLLLLQLAELSNRQGFDLAEAGWQSLHPAAAFSIPMPELFGSLSDWGAHWGPASPDWGGEPLAMHRGMLHAYGGALGVGALLWGLATGSIWRGETRLWLLATIGLLVYALGRYTPAFAVLFDTVPGVALFRRPADALIPMGLTLALLTGALLDGALRAPRRPTTGGTIAAALALALVIAGALALAAERGHRADALDAAARLVLLLAATALALYLARRLPARAGTAAALTLPALHAADLGSVHTATLYNAQVPRLHRELVEPTLAPHWAALEALLARPDPTGAPWRVETLALGTALQNIGQAAGYPDLLGYNPIRLRGLDRLIAPGQQNNAGPRRAWGLEMTGYGSALTDRLGLRYLVLGRPVEEIDPSIAPGRLRLIGLYPRLGGRVVRIYENPRAEPRAVVEPRGSVQITSYRHAEIALVAACPEPCRIVLREMAYPGWEAEAGGVRRPIETHDGLFRAIALPAGRHDVRMRFRPVSAEALTRAAAGVLGR